MCASERDLRLRKAVQIDAADFVQRFGPDSPEPPRSPGQEPSLGFPWKSQRYDCKDMWALSALRRIAPCLLSERWKDNLTFLVLYNKHDAVWFP